MPTETPAYGGDSGGDCGGGDGGEGSAGLRVWLESEVEAAQEADGRVVMAIDGKVYDVTKGWSFYGPGGGYSMLGGRDASRALAKMSLDEKDVDEPRIDDLTAEENKTLDEWVEKLGKKYTLLGDLEDA